MDTGKSIAAGLGSTLSGPKRLLLLGIHYWTTLQVVLIGLTLGIPWAGLRWRLLAGLWLLYLVPPLAAGILRGLAPLREGRLPVGQRDFFVWWAMFNLQVIFCRLPALEEVLRLVPGLYGIWLRLWGARVGRLIYWGAGLRILDRSLVRIGDGVIFGAAVRLNPHVLARNKSDEVELLLAKITIGDAAMIGGYSLLTAGTEIAAGECTKAFLISPPFSKWQGGTRIPNPEVGP
ncbi:MAG: acyl transferase [Verrucomicrobia bacterium]|nr:acyl transferase [Verrucomicrobiota bacterium]